MKEWKKERRKEREKERFEWKTISGFKVEKDKSGAVTGVRIPFERRYEFNIDITEYANERLLNVSSERICAWYKQNKEVRDRCAELYITIGNLNISVGNDVIHVGTKV